jgi:hypothetical protein
MTNPPLSHGQKPDISTLTLRNLLANKANLPSSTSSQIHLNYRDKVENAPTPLLSHHTGRDPHQTGTILRNH